MFKLLKSNPRKALKELLGDYSLPSFPAVTMQVLKDIRDPEATSSSVAESLSLDPGLSVQVLATVNSAAFAPRQRVDDLPHAVAMLGISNLEGLVLTIAVKETLPNPTCQGFLSKRFWLAAARRATTAQALAHLLHPATRSACFTAALLQDMAVPLLANSRPDVYGPVLEQWHDEQGPLWELEQSAMGTDHAEVATWLCDQWSLPENLSLAVGGHHQPSGSVEACPPALCLVALIRESEKPSGVDQLIALAQDRYGLDKDQLVALVDKSFEEAEELALLFQ